MVLRNKINFLLPSLKPYGGIRVIIELSNILVAKGYRVELIMPNNNIKSTNFSLDERIVITKIGKYRKYFFLKIYNISRTLIRAYKLQKKEIVIITEPLQSIVLSFFPQDHLLRFLQADDYCIFDDGDLLKFTPAIYIYKRLCRISYKRIKYFFFNSHFTFLQFKNISKRNDISCCIVSPGVNHKVFNTDTLRLETAYLRICIIARKQVSKGFKDFIEVWNVLSNEEKKHIDEVSVITPDDLSEFFPPKKFKLYHPASDIEIASIMTKADIFIFTSLNEGFGLPPLEAMACGCAVITSDCGGINDFVQHEYNGLIYPPKDINALSECLRILILNKEIRKKIASNGIKTALNYSWENSTNKLLEILEKIP